MHARSTRYDKGVGTGWRWFHEHPKSASQSQRAATNGGDFHAVRFTSSLLIRGRKGLQRPSDVDRLGAVIGDRKSTRLNSSH